MSGSESVAEVINTKLDTMNCTETVVVDTAVTEATGSSPPASTSPTTAVPPAGTEGSAEDGDSALPPPTTTLTIAAPHADAQSSVASEWSASPKKKKKKKKKKKSKLNSSAAVFVMSTPAVPSTEGKPTTSTAEEAETQEVKTPFGVGLLLQERKADDMMVVELPYGIGYLQANLCILLPPKSQRGGQLATSIGRQHRDIYLPQEEEHNYTDEAENARHLGYVMQQWYDNRRQGGGAGYDAGGLYEEETPFYVPSYTPGDYDNEAVYDWGASTGHHHGTPFFLPNAGHYPYPQIPYRQEDIPQIEPEITKAGKIKYDRDSLLALQPFFLDEPAIPSELSFLLLRNQWMNNFKNDRPHGHPFKHANSSNKKSKQLGSEHSEWRSGLEVKRPVEPNWASEEDSDGDELNEGPSTQRKNKKKKKKKKKSKTFRGPPPQAWALHTKQLLQTAEEQKGAPQLSPEEEREIADALFRRTINKLAPEKLSKLMEQLLVDLKPLVKDLRTLKTLVTSLHQVSQGSLYFIPLYARFAVGIEASLPSFAVDKTEQGGSKHSFCSLLVHMCLKRIRGHSTPKVTPGTVRRKVSAGSCGAGSISSTAASPSCFSTRSFTPRTSLTSLDPSDILTQQSDIEDYTGPQPRGSGTSTTCAVLTPEEQEEAALESALIARDSRQANVQLLGELFRHNSEGRPKKVVVEPADLHASLKILLKRASGESPCSDAAEDFVMLLTTVGDVLENQELVEMKKEADSRTLDGYFAAVASLTQNQALPQRLRFKLMDLQDLRCDQWPEEVSMSKLRGPHACKDGVPVTSDPPSAKSKLKAKLKQFSEKRTSKRLKPGAGKPGGMAALIGYTGPKLRARKRTGSVGPSPMSEFARVAKKNAAASASSAAKASPSKSSPSCDSSSNSASTTISTTPPHPSSSSSSDHLSETPIEKVKTPFCSPAPLSIPRSGGSSLSLEEDSFKAASPAGSRPGSSTTHGNDSGSDTLRPWRRQLFGDRAASSSRVKENSASTASLAVAVGAVAGVMDASMVAPSRQVTAKQEEPLECFASDTEEESEEVMFPSKPAVQSKQIRPMSMEHARKSINSCVTEYVQAYDVDEVVLCFQEVLEGITLGVEQDFEIEKYGEEAVSGDKTLSLLSHYLVEKIVFACIEGKDKTSQDKCGHLLVALNLGKHVSVSDTTMGISRVLENMEDIVLDVPKAPTLFAALIAQIISQEVLSYGDVLDAVPPTLPRHLLSNFALDILCSLQDNRPHDSGTARVSRMWRDGRKKLLQLIRSSCTPTGEDETRAMEELSTLAKAKGLSMIEFL